MRAKRPSKTADPAYAEYDDADSIAHDMQDQAIAERAWSAKGVLACVDHAAAHEDRAFDDCVIDPAFIDLLALRRGADADALIAQVTPQLERRAERAGGKQQRAYYVLVRWFGPDSAYARAGLEAGPIAQTGVLHALDNPVFEDTGRVPVHAAGAPPMYGAIPAALLPALAELLDPRTLTKRAQRGSWTDFARIVRVLLRVESEGVAPLLLRSLESEELRPALLEALAADRSERAPSPLPAAVRARFEAAAAGIERSRTSGLPSRVDLAMAGGIAAIAGRDRELAKRTAAFFDLVPGPQGSAEPVVPLARLLAASIDLLDANELSRLAAQMTLAPAERLPATAAAWVRLDIAEATKLAAAFKQGDRATADARWAAAARAQLQLATRDPAITALIPHTALASQLAYAPADLARFILDMWIKKARTPEELRQAVQASAERRESGVLRAVLEKLREVPFKIDAPMESAIGRLIDRDGDDAVQDEIDGENPFRDRCAALERALSAARSSRG